MTFAARTIDGSQGLSLSFLLNVAQLTDSGGSIYTGYSEPGQPNAQGSISPSPAVILGRSIVQIVHIVFSGGGPPGQINLIFRSPGFQANVTVVDVYLNNVLTVTVPKVGGGTAFVLNTFANPFTPGTTVSVRLVFR